MWVVSVESDRVEDAWFDRFVTEVLADLPRLSWGNHLDCRMCYRTFLAPCLARGCEMDHFGDEPGCRDWDHPDDA